MTGSDIDHDRRTSYGSRSAHSFAHGEEAIDEDSEPSESEDDEPTTTLNPSDVSTVTEGSLIPMPTHSEINRAVQAVKAEMNHNYAAPSDSGVGTDLATAALGDGSECDADYFRRAAEEESTVG